MYQYNDTSNLIDEIYRHAIVVSAVFLQVVGHMPLWLIYIFFVLHKGERYENELNVTVVKLTAAAQES